MRILAFGDSITYGAWDTEAGWVERVKRYAHSQAIVTEGQKKLQVINLGIGGDTSAKVLKRASNEIEARYSPNWPFVLVFCVGTNDERAVNGKTDIALDDYSANIREIIKIAKQHTDKIIFLGIPPLGKPVVEFKKQEYADARIEMYDKALKDVVLETGNVYLPIRPIFENNSSDNLFAYDDLHPNDKGHKLIAEAVIELLEKL